MRIYKAGYWVYATARRVVRSTGLITLIRPDLRAAAARLVHRAFINPTLPLTIHGNKMFLAPAGRFAPPDLVGDRYELDTTRLFELLLKPGDVMLDIGAHVGYYTLLAAKLVGASGKVYAFEPEPENYATLLRNIELNKLDNVVAVRKAISNRNTPCQFFLSQLDNGNHSLVHLGLPEKGTISVETTTLDQFLEEVGWPRIDIIKMDIEGSELAALEGMEKFFARAQQIRLVIEFCPWILKTLKVEPIHFLDYLAAAGFKIHVINRNGTVPVEQVNVQVLIDRLLNKDGYTNLLCIQ